MDRETRNVQVYNERREIKIYFVEGKTRRRRLCPSLIDWSKSKWHGHELYSSILKRCVCRVLSFRFSFHEFSWWMQFITCLRLILYLDINFTQTGRRGAKKNLIAGAVESHTHTSHFHSSTHTQARSSLLFSWFLLSSPPSINQFMWIWWDFQRQKEAKTRLRTTKARGEQMGHGPKPWANFVQKGPKSRRMRFSSSFVLFRRIFSFSFSFLLLSLIIFVFQLPKIESQLNWAKFTN